MLQQDIYKKLLNLFQSQKWLIKKELELLELISFCTEMERLDLILDLLHNFSFMNQDHFNNLLKEMACFIVYNSGFCEDRTQIVALAWDEEPDSSQAILQAIKVKLANENWRNVKLVNTVGKAIKSFKDGRDQIILIDEFIGTGQTFNIRYEWLSKGLKDNYEIQGCYLVGMENAINEIKKSGIKIYCPYQLKMGISENYSIEKVEELKKCMIDLENTILKEKINDKELTQYSLGYNAAEALYSSEDCGGNTPNSVFPVFWWPLLKDNRRNNSILTRFENGF